jgi:hypothetical protein
VRPSKQDIDSQAHCAREHVSILFVCRPAHTGRRCLDSTVEAEDSTTTNVFFARGHSIGIDLEAERSSIAHLEVTLPDEASQTPRYCCC